MQNFVNPKSEVTVQKTIPELKDIMKEVIETKVYSLTDHNDGFNIYRLSMLEGLTAIVISVQLQAIDESNSKIIFEAMRPTAGGASHEMLQSKMNGLMSIVGKAVNGEPITPEMVKANSKSSGCLWTIILLIVAAFFIYYILSR